MNQQGEPKPRIEFCNRLSRHDNELFRTHFDNIAARKGWFVHRSNWARMTLVLPHDQLSELDRIAVNPEQWVQSNLDHPPATGPVSTHLVHARVNLDTSYGNYFWTLIPLSVLAVTTAGTFLLSLTGMVVFSGAALRGREYSVVEVFR